MYKRQSQGNVITQKNIIAIDSYILSAISSATRSKIVRMNVFPKGAWNCPLYRSTVYVPDTVQSNRVPDSAAYFTTGGTAYWNTVTGTRSWNSTDQCLRITASTTHQVSIQRASGIYTIGKTYKISFKYRASGYTNKINIIQAGVTVNVENNQTPNCSSSWQTFTTYCSSIYNTYTGFTAASNLTSGQYICLLYTSRCV